MARGQVDGGRDDPGVREGRRRGEGGDDAVDVLVGHRRRHERDADPRVEERPEVVEGGGEGRGAGRVVGAVEEHVATAGGQQLQPARPGRRRRSRRRRAASSTRAMPGGRERVEDRVGDGDVRRLVPAAQADAGPPEPRQLDGRARRGPSREERGRRHHGQRHAEPPRPGAG